jgi:dolichyl-phosphate beta-glucosyltransferase
MTFANGAFPTRSVVVPMYREASRIGTSIDTIAQSALDDERTELIFVDDGSDDGTADLVASLLQQHGLRARVLRLDRNQGKGAAVRAGMLAAQGDVVAFVDADLSAGVDEVDRCLRLVEEDAADVVVASRAHPHSTIAVPQPALRQLSGKVFNLVLRLLGLASISDTQCGLKAFRRDAAHKIFSELAMTGFSFDVEVLYRALQNGMRVSEFPIVWKHVEASRVRPVRDGIDMLREVVRLRRALGRLPAVPIGDTMAHETFDAMAKLEAEHWWFRAKRELALQYIAEQSVSGLTVDVGCGTGELVFALHELGQQTVVGVDLSRYALQHANSKVLVREEAVSFLQASAEALPLGAASASCLVSMDVIEHLDDDVAALREYARVVEPGGLLLVAVPAYAWAWSDHDESLGHRRRYTASQLVERARAAGLEVEYVTHYHSWVTPIALLLRKTPLKLFLRGSKKTAEEVSFVHPLVNGVLLRLARAERRLARRMALPFGLSIMLVARAPRP